MNQNPEQLARDEIDRQLIACGWVIQNKNTFNLTAGIGVATREFQTNVGPADYILFVNQKPVGLIEAKREEEGVRLTMHEDFRKQAGTLKYTEEQVQWLRMIKDYIAASFHVDKEDFELDPFNKQGGLGKMWQLFGEETDVLINELNESLVA
jgi:type I site-specific restriction endonuclease